MKHGRKIVHRLSSNACIMCVYYNGNIVPVNKSVHMRGTHGPVSEKESQTEKECSGELQAFKYVCVEYSFANFDVEYNSFSQHLTCR